MTILIVSWFLFAYPLSLAIAFVLGAHLYHTGSAGRGPGLSLPRFGVSRNGQGKAETSERLPRV